MLINLEIQKSNFRRFKGEKVRGLSLKLLIGLEKIVMSYSKWYYIAWFD